MAQEAEERRVNKEDDGLPNFDNFLGRQTSATADANKTNISTVNKVRFGPDSPKGGNAAFPTGNVRIHQTDMQRYLQGLMQNNQLGLPDEKKSDSNNYMIPQLKPQPADALVAKPPSFMKGNIAGSGQLGNMNQNIGPLGGGGSSSINASQSSSPNYNTGGPMQRSNSTASNRQKNDKPVEVHHDHKVIARFRTQTECARYLRATPEAVSYHCSKGGGVCNGLVIRPLAECDTSRFGLFEGAVDYRPRERPQLKPETVAILKDWLLSPEHVGNPYPNLKEIEMLMQKTGLDKTQLKHWFNNARKRILKPLLKNGGKELPPKEGRGRGKKKRSDPSSAAAASSSKKKKKRKSLEMGSEDAASLMQNTSMCGTISTASSGAATHKMSNLSREGLLGNSFSQDFQHSNSAGSANNMMMSNQYERLMMGQGMQGMQGSMMNPMLQGMMGGMGGMMGNNPDNFGAYAASMGMGGGGFNGCMEVNDNPFANQGFPPNRMGSAGSDRQGYYQDQGFNQDGYNNNEGEGFCPTALPTPPNQGESDDAARTTAVFKQQVATMAMNEASTAFKDMEDAFAQAKEVMSQHPEDNHPLVSEANAHAKKCQSVAMFKLKVSQRASEEAANAYDSYQSMVDGGDASGGGTPGPQGDH